MKRADQKPRLHLISAPWAQPFTPSIQIGSLKAYADARFGRRIWSKTYAANLEILTRFRGILGHHYFCNFNTYHTELPYLLLCHKSFLEKTTAKDFKKLLAEMKFNPAAIPLSPELLKELEDATRSYADDEILPWLSKTSMNVIGFTVNFNQLYGSIYLQKYIEKKARGRKLMFLYGGFGASSPLTARMLKMTGASGFRVIGEGEKKLGMILDGVLNGSPPADFSAEGIEPVAWGEKNLAVKPDSYFKSQIADLSELPLPDYRDYFQTFTSLEKQEPGLRKYRDKIALPLEGTRGCFSHCDFCSLNAQWRGFRKMSADEVYERAMAASGKYGVTSLLFVDTVCDTWAERFAERAIHDGRALQFMMELRVHHPESFWIKLARAGLSQAVIGIEALSEPLLRKMGKGTHVYQNVLAQKYLSELGVKFDAHVISHHPKSLLSDVAETRRVMEHTWHLAPFHLTRFWLEANSPIFDALPEEDKKSLKPWGSQRLPSPLKKYTTDSSIKMPASVALPNNLERAWDDLSAWLDERRSRYSGVSCRITDFDGKRLQIEDERSGRKKTRILTEEETALYLICHRGAKMESIMKSGPGESILVKNLSKLISERLILQIGDRFIALATRPRSDLIPESGASPRPEILPQISYDKELSI